jgi:co-chaperonin GroES (HSP10)
MQAIQDNIIVKPIYQDKIGNIIIPGGSKFGKNSGKSTFQLYEGFIYGEVISIGPTYPSQKIYEKLFSELGEQEANKRIKRGNVLKVGDNVIWTRHEGIKFTYDNEEYIKLKPQYVLGIIKKPDNKNA